MLYTLLSVAPAFYYKILMEEIFVAKETNVYKYGSLGKLGLICSKESLQLLRNFFRTRSKGDIISRILEAFKVRNGVIIVAILIIIDILLVIIEVILLYMQNYILFLRSIVTHILQTIKDFDMIYVLSNGKMIESGSHEILLEHGKKNRELLQKDE